VSISLRRIFAITKKNLQILLHDKRTLGLLLGMPILLMFLFGFAFGQTVKHVPIKIVNLDEIGGSGNINYSEIFINTLQEDDRVDITILNPTNFDLVEEKA